MHSILIIGVLFWAPSLAQNLTWKSTEMLMGSYDQEIHLPECLAVDFNVTECRFSRRYLGYTEYWKENGKFYNEEPTWMDPYDVISCSQVIRL